MSIKITGLAEIKRNAEAACGKVLGAIDHGVVAYAEQVADAAATRTPQDTRELIESRYVAPRGDGTVEIGYGAAHAVPVHEKTEVGHDTGEAKFLERAVDTTRQGALQTIASNLGPLRKGGRAQPRKHPRRPPGGRGT